jgi:hypothetical protein
LTYDSAALAAAIRASDARSFARSDSFSRASRAISADAGTAEAAALALRGFFAAAAAAAGAEEEEDDEDEDDEDAGTAG